MALLLHVSHILLRHYYVSTLVHLLLHHYCLVLLYYGNNVPLLHVIAVIMAPSLLQAWNITVPIITNYYKVVNNGSYY